jgi:hypothetical protein
MVVAVERKLQAEHVRFTRQRSSAGWPFGDQGGVLLALAAIEGLVAGAVRELAGELVAADAFPRGQIREGGLPADSLGAASAEILRGAKQGQRNGGG